MEASEARALTDSVVVVPALKALNKVLGQVEKAAQKGERRLDTSVPGNLAPYIEAALRTKGYKAMWIPLYGTMLVEW